MSLYQLSYPVSPDIIDHSYISQSQHQWLATIQWTLWEISSEINGQSLSAADLRSWRINNCLYRLKQSTLTSCTCLVCSSSFGACFASSPAVFFRLFFWDFLCCAFSPSVRFFSSCSLSESPPPLLLLSIFCLRFLLIFGVDFSVRSVSLI